MRKLQHLLLKIPKGKVTTYKEIGQAMGTRGYRYVGQLLSKNPELDKFPCYKVVYSDRRVGGYAFGQKNKIQRLRNDGIVIKNGKVLNFESVFFKYI